MNSSLSAGRVDEQSASLPGRLRRCETEPLLRTVSIAARDADRARAARITRWAMAVACVRLLSRKFSNPVRTSVSIWAVISGLPSFSLV